MKLYEESAPLTQSISGHDTRYSDAKRLLSLAITKVAIKSDITNVFLYEYYFGSTRL